MLRHTCAPNKIHVLLAGVYRNNKSTVETYYEEYLGKYDTVITRRLFLLSVHRVYVVPTIAMARLRSFFPWINIKEKEANWKYEKAFTVVETMFASANAASHPTGRWFRSDGKEKIVCPTNRRTRRVSPYNTHVDETWRNNSCFVASFTARNGQAKCYWRATA